MVGTAAAASALAAFASSSLQAENNSVSREQVVAWLRHQEQLVRSIECEYEYRYDPTSPQIDSQLRELFKDYPDPNAQFASAHFSKEDAEKFSHLRRFWRKGAKERWDQFNLGDDIDSAPPRESEAFDSQILRAFSPKGEDGKPVGSVESAQRAFWDKMPREDPSTFLFNNYEVPYSKLIESGSQFQAAEVDYDGQKCIRVSVTCSEQVSAGQVLILTFDHEHRLLERWVKLGPPLYPTNPPVDHEQDVFSDYQAHRDASGEVIWFPNEAVYRTFQGKLHDGTLVANTAEHFKVHNIQFNTDIPDSLFDLKIPTDAKVYDGVTGQGWLAPGVRPPALFPDEFKISPWRVPLVIGLALATLAAAGAVFLVYKRRAKKLSQGNKSAGS
jgi:hypothetical protein